MIKLVKSNLPKHQAKPPKAIPKIPSHLMVWCAENYDLTWLVYENEGIKFSWSTISGNFVARQKNTTIKSAERISFKEAVKLTQEITKLESQKLMAWMLNPYSVIWREYKEGNFECSWSTLTGQLLIYQNQIQMPSQFASSLSEAVAIVDTILCVSIKDYSS